MIKVILNGCSGKMGKVITEVSSQFPSLEIIGGIDKYPIECSYPIFKTCDDLTLEYDVLLDFSRSEALNDLLMLTEKTKKPIVLCSTGYTEENLKLIDEKSKYLPIFRSANMSLGINLINSLLKKITPLLYGNYDIEIVEKHHNQKVDSPSGTALFLADTIKNSLPVETNYVHGRDGQKKREKTEIGIHAVRGGSIVGDHEIIFAGTGEVIELTHKAISREVFAVGALKACDYMGTTSEPGLYTMDNIIDL
ncbi:4-hydroxy-tetrahydrodipicolinate reductase [Clostridium gasigenes]|uniref:4-hydroxy-tetrahydrodipicolinate reductase n=1 Tax=Clostridium gasigenes TaxID=94869 RepID=A0A7X0SI64_9CLOT|nr:4-hydroxy-tetrahydrodipicolinate reductase [Clostridium gasigenes]MBB6716783.1 4-hydroxy-tetrahydrodipicolinate reductase [Clostridium gasigenes]